MIRITTKSTAIRYQLRDLDGNAVGAPVSSLGTGNGDDRIRNVPPGQYYLEVSRSGYISACTPPFTVGSTRVIFRNAPSTNYFDLLATGSGNTLSGTVIDAVSGLPIEGVKIVCLPYNNTRGAGVPIFTATDGTFSYLTVNTAKDLVFSKDGYISKIVYRAAGNASGLVIELEPGGPSPMPVEEAIVEIIEEGADEVIIVEETAEELSEELIYVGGEDLEEIVE
jgi:hypothetical protein